VPTLYLTNAGLEDVLRIGRQARDELYNLTPLPHPDPLSTLPTLGVQCRRDADGNLVEPLTEAALARVVEAVVAASPQAVAINLLFDYLNDEEERRLTDALRGRVPFVCHGAEVLPVAGEFERGVATWLNAWLGPRVAAYLARLSEGVGKCPLSIMQSHAGTISAPLAAKRAVNLLLSGPAGGLCAARAVGQSLGQTRLLTFDMGGTSSDVALIDGDVRLTLEGRIGPWPVAVPMVDMHTIGAGGGSLAYVDDAGMLHVGPESAGADPGPACYGRGGEHFTVTDANLLAGRLQPSFALGGSLQLDVSAARRACARLAQQLGLDEADTVRGVLALANEHMAQALRVISIQKGEDPAEYALLSFGGAGGLHVCALARMLGMSRAIVPRNSGVLSAQGMLQAPPQRELVQALPASADAGDIDRLVDALAGQGEQALHDEGHSTGLTRQRFVEMCYQGQSFQLSVPWRGDLNDAIADFHAAHEQRYGHRLALPVVAARVRVQLRAPVDALVWPACGDTPAAPDTRVTLMDIAQPVPVYAREALAAGQTIEGPALITEAVATTYVEPGWSAQVSTAGHLLLATR